MAVFPELTVDKYAFPRRFAPEIFHMMAMGKLPGGADGTVNILLILKIRRTHALSRDGFSGPIIISKGLGKNVLSPY